MKNRYEVRREVTAIFVKGVDGDEEVIIDTCELPVVASLPKSWGVSPEGYIRMYVMESGKRTAVSLHRLIVGVAERAIVRHRDKDHRNNRRSNLMLRIIPDKHTGTLAERFMACVSIDKDTGCWNWTGTISNKGYGRFAYDGGQHQAHRFAYRLLVGDIPDELPLDHLCRNRACVNPEHLEPVTNRENTLRGDGVTAQNAKAAYCKRGHPFDLTNTKWEKNGRRECVACNRRRRQEWRRRKGAGQALQKPLSESI